jgi:hypothetical protein
MAVMTLDWPRRNDDIDGAPTAEDFALLFIVVLTPNVGNLAIICLLKDDDRS